MEAYKFVTTVLENGLIKIPQIYELKNKQVEVLVLVKYEPVEVLNTDMTAELFFKKWAGVLKTSNSDKPVTSNQ